MEYSIRRINKDEYASAMKLVLDVYMEFEAPVYGEEGVNTFLKDIVNSEKYKKDFEEGINIIIAAFSEDKMIGVVGTRGTNHIGIVFTDKDYQRKGVAKNMMHSLIEEIKKVNPDIKEITLNSSPYGLAFYHKFGFIDTDVEQLTNGIKYTPMKYDVNKMMLSNKEIVKEFFDKGYNVNDYSIIAKLLAPNYYDHSPAGARSPEDAINILKIVQRSFLDMKVEILDLIEEDNKVVGRFKFSAIHSTEYMGVKATNKKIEWQAIEIFRIENGVIVESWGYWPDSEILYKLKKLSE